ncbi:MAG: SusC/RagA family TonB-linked outer membrane protein [Cytophagales bacterium]|nr:SusC/RagA family TonB-linked outer membrane protein [Cytophagales bacterium]
MKLKLRRLIIMASKLSLYGFTIQCILMSSLWASIGNAQQIKSVREVYIKLDLQDVELNETFRTIELQTDFKFAFDKQDIRHKKFTISQRSISVADALMKISEETDLKFKQVNNNINVDKRKSFESEKIEIVIQGITITGKVTSSEDNTGLPGVNVIVKGTTKGSVTDVEGNYAVEVVDENSVLVFSSVGYLTEEIVVANQATIDIVLSPDITALEEIVVVGYGTMKKSDLTGAVAKVETEPLRELPNVNVMSSLQGMIPGFNVGAVDNSGEEPNMSIRGQNTLSSSSDDNRPLFVVDGMIYRGSMVDLNTADIESVEALKDASAAAIYGSQSSNGVVLITTKKGGAIGKPIISYDGFYSIQVPSNKLQPFNGAELEDFTNDAYWIDSRIPPDYLDHDPDFTFAPRLKNNDVTEGYLNGLDNDWWGMLTGNGSINSHNLGIRGRSDAVGYFVSLGYLDQDGFLINDDYKRINTRVNLDAKIANWLTIGGETFMTNSDYSGVSPSVNQSFHMQPWAPVYDANGEYLLEPVVGLSPLLQIQQDDSDKRLNLFGKFYSDIKLPFLEGFNYRLNYSHNYRTTNQDRFNPWGANFTGSGYKNSYIFYDWILDNIISYKRTFNNDHKIDLTLLYGVEHREYSYTESSAQNFSKMTLGYNKLEAGDPTLNSINTGAEEEKSLYTMARLYYGFKSKYMITGTVRRDGFSGFGTEDKIGIFPSVGLAWVAGDEPFIADNLSFLDNLKIRASYGTTGRRGVGRYETLAKLSIGPSRVFGDGGTSTLGQWISTMANNELGWETTTGINLGLDFGIFGSRLYGNFEYYNNDTEDILYDIQLPNLTGFSTVPTNIGKVHNYGFEFSLTGLLIRKGDLRWDATFNYAQNRNRIESILGVDNDGDGIEDDIITNQLFIGEPQNVVFDYKIIGMWQLADEEAGEIPNGFFPGNYKIEDTNDDGEYTPDDRQILAYRDPAYRWSISTRLDYKNWGLYVFVNSIQGGRNYYYADGSPYTDGNQYKIDQLSYNNVSGWDYWMPENPDAKYRRLDIPSQFHPSPYDQRSFVRLQDVSLSYKFNRELLDRWGIGNLKLYVSGKNLLTLTNWEGWDPETGVGIRAGVPVMTGYTFGLNLEF